VGKTTDKNTSLAEQTDEESLVTFHSQNEKQKMQKLTKTEQRATMYQKMKKLVNDVSAVRSKLQDNHEATTIKEKSEVNLQNYDLIKEEIKKLREELNENNMTKRENKELKFKVECLMQLNNKQMKRYEETVKSLEDSLYRISTENKKLKEEICWIRECHMDDLKSAKRDEAMRLFRAAGCWKINEKQVSHSFASCRESGAFNINATADGSLVCCCAV
jgi:chromosome segregation ATPase